MEIRERFVGDIARILAAIRIGPAGELDFGRYGEAASSAGLDSATRLQHWLYQRCFCNCLDDGNPAAVDATAGNLLVELSKANTGKEEWESGWEIAHLDAGGRVTAKRHDRVRNFWPGEFLTVEGPELPPRPGMHLRAHFRHESSTMQPGYYFAFGSYAEEEFEALSIVRFYWAVKSSGAVALLGAITEALNRLRVPFRFKTGVEAHSYGRLDAAVLYVHKRFYQITARLIAPVHSRLRGDLLAGAPMFTKPLAPGLGLAEDPGTGESFGMQRCRVLADAILAARLVS